jgi:hypothetical protein
VPQLEISFFRADFMALRNLRFSFRQFTESSAFRFSATAAAISESEMERPICRHIAFSHLLFSLIFASF